MNVGVNIVRVQVKMAMELRDTIRLRNQSSVSCSVELWTAIHALYTGSLCTCPYRLHYVALETGMHVCSVYILHSFVALGDSVVVA
jgi:hypothetical protein